MFESQVLYGLRAVRGTTVQSSFRQKFVHVSSQTATFSSMKYQLTTNFIIIVVNEEEVNGHVRMKKGRTSQRVRNNLICKK